MMIDRSRCQFPLHPHHPSNTPGELFMPDIPSLALTHAGYQDFRNDPDPAVIEAVGKLLPTVRHQDSDSSIRWTVTFLYSRYSYVSVLLATDGITHARTNEPTRCVGSWSPREGY